jgi:hypothetical protein
MPPLVADVDRPFSITFSKVPIRSADLHPLLPAGNFSKARTIEMQPVLRRHQPPLFYEIIFILMKIIGAAAAAQGKISKQFCN